MEQIYIYRLYVYMEQIYIYICKHTVCVCIGVCACVRVCVCLAVLHAALSRRQSVAL